MQIWYAHCFTMGSQLYSQDPVVDPVPSPTSALKKKGNKVICGDSFHLGILTVLTTRPEVQGSYEVEGSCVMFIFLHVFGHMVFIEAQSHELMAAKGCAKTMSYLF